MPVASSPIRTPAQLADRLEPILDDPALARAHVGLYVQVAETGEVLYSRNARKRFLPASNAKLITGAVALHSLGPSYRWTTRLQAAGPVREGVLRGNLWVVGGGDPRITRADLGRWSDALREAGIDEVTGDLVGDDRAFPGPRWGAGWTWTDLYSGWGAGVSALRLHPGRVRAGLLPGPALGSPALLRPRGRSPLPQVENGVRTGPPGSEVRLEFVPRLEQGPVRLSGWIPADADTVPVYLAPVHPGRYLLEAFAGWLHSAGISLQGSPRLAREGEAPADSTWARAFRSDSLGAVLPELLKPSDNQIAEMLLRTLGMEKGLSGSDEQGLSVVERKLAEWGVSPEAADLEDGSGLSRYNQVTPAALGRLLRALWKRPHFDLFRNALPLAAEDGTLEGRLLGTPAAGNLRGKTGSLSSVRALSGYVSAGDGRTLVFSLLLNGYAGPGDVAESLTDLLVEQISLYDRPVPARRPGSRK